MIDNGFAATLDAVARFTERSPIACASPAEGRSLSAALWQHSAKVRRFEGHQRHILGISLRGDAHLEQILNGRSIWRGSAPGSIVLLQAPEQTDWCLDGSFEMLHVYLDSDRIPWDNQSPILARPFRDPVLMQLGLATALALRDTCGEANYVVPLLESLQQCLVDRYFQDNRDAPVAQALGLSRPVQRRVENFIRENLASDIPAETLAKVANLSVGHFNRAFRHSYGISPHQFLIDQRVTKAALLLATTAIDVGRIARETGFVSASHLGAHFKKRMGVTPTQFRHVS